MKQVAREFQLKTKSKFIYLLSRGNEYINQIIVLSFTAISCKFGSDILTEYKLFPNT